MTDIKNIIFDLGGVIVDLDASRCIDAFRQIGIPNAADYLLAHSAERLLQATEVEGISTHAFCDMIRELWGPPQPPKDIVWAWNQFLAVPQTDVPQVLRLLSSARHPTACSAHKTNGIHLGLQWH
jgi:putative hydrolase of the HAD superfamily